MKDALDFIINVLKKLNLSFSSSGEDGQKLSLDIKDEERGINAGVSVVKPKNSDTSIKVNLGNKE